MIGSAYGWSGEGPKGRSLTLLSAIPQLGSQAGPPILVGCDFNFSPSQIKATRLLQKASLEILEPERGTCATGSWKGAPTIDLFVTIAGLSSAVSKPTALRRNSLQHTGR